MVYSSLGDAQPTISKYRHAINELHDNSGSYVAYRLYIHLELLFDVTHLQLPWWQEPNRGKWLGTAAKMKIWLKTVKSRSFCDLP